jgi:hypothetical protein
VLADYIGPNKILWATDYPHPDGFFPGAPAMIANQPECIFQGRLPPSPWELSRGIRRPELSEDTKRGVLAGGAKAFYGPQ